MCHWIRLHLHEESDYNGVAFSIALLEWSRTFSGFGVLMLCFEHLSDQKFIILEVYIWYGGACDVFRAKSFFRTNNSERAIGQFNSEEFAIIDVFTGSYFSRLMV